jgi:cobalt-zinc-cadmium efflux system outer membrane protein
MVLRFSVAEAQGATNQPPSEALPVAGLQELSLSQAQRLAFERNWDLLAAKSGMDTAAAQLIVAKEFPNPTFSWSTTKVDPNGSATPMGNGFWDRSYDTVFAISQLVEVAGKRGARQSSANAGVTGARARFFDARRTLEQGVTKSYVAALLAEENARILNDSSRSLRHEADIAQARLKAGDISESDERQIENNAEAFELQAKSAEAAAVQARIAVEILMGVAHPQGHWTAQDSLEQLSVVPPQTNSATGVARPDVLAAEADVRKAKADLKLQRALRIPDPTFSAIYEHEPPGPPGPDTFGLGISFPLPIWNLNRGNIKAAEAALDLSAFALDKVRAQAAADIAGTQVNYQEAYDRWQRYETQIRPRAAKVRESVAYAYEKGGASLVDLLTAERDDNTVRLATAQAMSDTATAAADLKAARNVLSETELRTQK